MKRDRSGHVALFALAACAPACSNLESAPAFDRPTVRLMSPSDGQAVAFDEPFVLSAIAQAPKGASLIRAELVLQGATSAGRVLPLSGEEAPVQLQLLVPGAGFSGRDRVPLELELSAVSASGRTEVMSAPAAVGLVVIDRSPPSLEVDLPAGLPPPPMFDRAYPPGTSFTVQARARDPVGGVTRIEIIAPPFAGGTRSKTVPPSPQADFAVEIVPPVNGDLEIEVRAEDAATQPNVAGVTLHVRIGAGGTDQLPPSIAFRAPDHAECAEDVHVTALATDDASGVLQVNLRGEGFDNTAYGPDPAHPLVLSIGSTVAVGRDRPLSSRLSYVAQATDVAGNASPPEALELLVEDTRPPLLDHASTTQSDVAPGGSWPVALAGSEECGLIQEARATFFDRRHIPRRTSVPIGTQTIDETVTFTVPTSLCALSTVTASVALVDLGGLVSSSVAFQLRAHDTTPPALFISTRQGGGVLPGGVLLAEVRASDEQTPVKSATITVSALNLDLSLPPSARVSFPSSDCAALVDRVIPIQIPIPSDVRFLAPLGSVRIDADVSDAAGNHASASLIVPVVDRLPPDLAIRSPLAGSIVFAGDTVPLIVAASDLNHFVDFIAVGVTGPASIAAFGTRSATVAEGVRSATAALSLLIDPHAPLGAPIVITARARDTSLPFNERTVSLGLSTCGAPAIALISPSVGPRTGGQSVRITGSGFAPGATTFTLASIPLAGTRVQSASIAVATIPPGAYPPGLADAAAQNQCRSAQPSGLLPQAYRFAAPPTVALMRPRPGASASPGLPISVGFGAQADGVPLTDLSAMVAGSAGLEAAVSPPTTAAALDGEIAFPAGASGTITLSGTATDIFGQASTATLAIAVGTPVPLGLAARLLRTTLATGETMGLAIEADETDGRSRDVTLLASVESSDPSIVAVLGPDRLAAMRAGTATVALSIGSLSSSVRVTVVDRALIFASEPLYLSPNGSAPATIELWLLQNGGASQIPTSSVALSVRASTIAQVTGGAVTGLAEGDSFIDARLQGAQPLTASLPLRVRARLDVGPGETWSLPSGQTFSGGRVQGTIRAERPMRALGGFTIAVESGGSLAVEAGGRIEARGGSGSSLGFGGLGGAGGGGGGAAAIAQGAAGGFGEPPGAGTPDDRLTTPGGAGGGEAMSGGSGAGLFASSAGGGGGSAGPGGMGGHASGEGAALGGALRVQGGGAGGGGGRDGGGGGGGGALLIFDMAQADLRIDGILDASGGAGGARASAGTAGGGGGGGVLTIRANRLQGRGSLVVHGGPGGAAPVGTGGGGGGGRVTLTIGASESPFIDIDVAGGATAGSSGGVAGEAGGRGALGR